jgi:hypothetical protein
MFELRCLTIKFAGAPAKRFVPGRPGITRRKQRFNAFYSGRKAVFKKCPVAS